MLSPFITSVMFICTDIFETMSSTFEGDFFENTLREKCPHLELFWSAFSRIWTEYGEICRQMRENVDQNNSEYGHFLRSAS